METSWIIEQRASVILFNILCGLESDTEFFIPSNACPIVIATFFKARIKFKFVDISLDTLCIDLDRVKTDVSKVKKPGLLYIRNIGILHEVDEIFGMLKALAPELIIIDDRCLTKVTFNLTEFCFHADATLFSTGYGKYIDLNWGGLGMINCKRLSYKRKKLDFEEKDLGILNIEMRNCFKNMISFKYKDTNWLNANVVSMNLDDYREIIENKNLKMDIHKKKINAIYSSIIPNTYFPKMNFDLNSWRFTIFTTNKDKILKRLFANDCFASSHYASCSKIFGNSNSPNADLIHNKTVNLFNDHKVSEDVAIKISKIILEIHTNEHSK